MPVLKNPKHERFAQELAKGKSQVEAYELAGYSPNRSAAARLFADVNICARLAEMAERVADRTEVTVADITERLLAIAKKAEGKDEAPMLSVARASLMDAAKLNGLIVEKTEVGGPGDFDRMSDADLAGYVAREIAALGAGNGGTEAPGSEAAMRGQPKRVH